MTAELRRQRRDLMAANALAEERRAFIEAALSGVPAGVIGVDEDGVIAVANGAAERLMNAAPEALNGKRIDAVSPRLGEILDEAHSSRGRLHHSQATLLVGGRERLINVRVTGDPDRPDQGAVITLDDISELVAAQRSAAWADVARRIAHEIKNPLTPIQLSAERLKRRYGRHIVEGKDVFDQCTDTIIRQVDDIKRMVDEFSSFARMPRARLARDDLSDCVRQALFLARVGRADIAFEDDLPAEPLWADFDRRLISQALTNVLKNAGEGIDAREPGARARPHPRVSQRRRRGPRADRDRRQRQGLPQRRPPQAARALCHDPLGGNRSRPADRDQDSRRPRRNGRAHRWPGARRRRTWR